MPRLRTTLLTAAILVAAATVLADTVTLDRIWSRGGDADDEVLMGIPVVVTADAEDRTFVLDNQLSQVMAFGAGGELIGAIGREGEGPGEFQHPLSLITLPGDEIAVGSLFRGRFDRVALDGTPAGAISIGGDSSDGGMLVVYGAEYRGGTFLAAVANSAFDQSTGQMNRVQSLCLFGLDGSRKAVLCEKDIVMDFTGTRAVVEDELMRSFLIVHTVGPDGRAYVPRSRDEYAIQVFGPDGELQRVIERPDFEIPARTDRERRRIEALYGSWTANAGFEFPFEFSRSEMAVKNLFVDDRGHLFVRHAASHRDLPDGVFLRLDEFDPDGAYLGEVEVRGEGDPMMDTMAWLGHDRVAIVRGGALISLERWRDAPVYWEDEDEVTPEIVVCRWSR